jgi:putative Ca2+/H+ antiporter (TMEM165/GDT1 family)
MFTTYRRKSQILGLILTFLFGPIGLLYASVSAGLIMIFITLLLLVSAGALALVTTPICMALSVFIILSFNLKSKADYDRQEARYRNLLEASRRS